MTAGAVLAYSKHEPLRDFDSKALNTTIFPASYMSSCRVAASKLHLSLIDDLGMIEAQVPQAAWHKQSLRKFP